MENDKLLNPARVALTAFLKERKMRRTPERYAILEKVFSSDAHVYVDALHEALEMEGSHVSLSTVYSAIQLNQPAQYERVLQGVTESHHHLVCNVCGRVRPVKDPELMAHVNALKYPTFKTEFFTLYVYGLCSRCQKRLKREGGAK